MKNVFLFIVTGTIMLFLVSMASASVQEGRAKLFNEGDPYYEGILESHEHFKDALDADQDDPEANLFYAVTSPAVFALKAGDGDGLETMADVFEAMGMARNDNYYLFEGPPYDDPEELPENAPGGAELQDFLLGPYMDLLSEILSALNKLGTGFSTVLTWKETGNDEDVKVDYGEVQLYKAAVKFNQFLVNAISAYNLDLDIRKIFEDFDEEKDDPLPRNYINNYLESNPELFNLIAEAEGRLKDAEELLIEAVEIYLDASEFIRDERTDRSMPYLISFDEESLGDEELFRENLVELKASLDEKRAAHIYFKTQDLHGYDDDELINLNPFFGNDGGPYNLRDLLPKINQCNFAISGTMGHGLGNDPTLGGIFPDLTQDDWDFETPVCVLGMPWLFLLLDDEK